MGTDTYSMRRVIEFQALAYAQRWISSTLYGFRTELRGRNVLRWGDMDEHSHTLSFRLNIEDPESNHTMAGTVQLRYCGFENFACGCGKYERLPSALRRMHRTDAPRITVGHVRSNSTRPIRPPQLTHKHASAPHARTNADCSIPNRAKLKPNQTQRTAHKHKQAAPSAGAGLYVAGHLWRFDNRTAQCLVPGDVVTNAYLWSPVEDDSYTQTEAVDVRVELAELLGEYGARAAAAGLLRVPPYTARLYLGYAHDGPIGCKKRGYILTMDPSDVEAARPALHYRGHALSITVPNV
eukprot:3011014-Pyramimonas_sp.AAC.2